MTPSDSLSAARHFPGSPVIDGRTPHPRRTRAEEGLSSSHDGLLDVPRSIRRGVLEHRLQDLTVPSMAFAQTPRARLSLSLLSQATSRRCKLHLMLRTANLLHPASDPAFRPTPGVSLPGTLASPRTGLAPAGRRQLVVRLRHDCSFALMAPDLLDAQDFRGMANLFGKPATSAPTPVARPSGSARTSPMPIANFRVQTSRVSTRDHPNSKWDIQE